MPVIPPLSSGRWRSPSSLVALYSCGEGWAGQKTGAGGVEGFPLFPPCPGHRHFPCPSTLVVRAGHKQGAGGVESRPPSPGTGLCPEIVVRAGQDTNKVLAVSRVMVAWQPVGISWGVYDMCVRYLSERDQFGSSLSSFQVCLRPPSPSHVQIIIIVLALSFLIA